MFNWDKKKIEFGVNVDCSNLASIKSAEKAFKSKGKENEVHQNIKIEQAIDDKESQKEDVLKTGSSMIATHKQSSTSLQKKQTESILDKIDKSSQDIK